jgi:hypothetical protein
MGIDNCVGIEMPANSAPIRSGEAAERAAQVNSDAARGFPAPTLPLACYILVFRAVEPIELPPFAGNLWRGVLGRALKRIADGLDPAPREFDVARAQALYRDLFETPPPPDAAKMRRYSSVPHPYVIAAPFSGSPLRLARGEETAVGLTLIGRANEALGTIVAGFRRAAEAGIGKSRGRMVLEKVDAAFHMQDGLLPVYRPAQPVVPALAEAPPIPPVPRYLAVELASPLRLESEKPTTLPDGQQQRARKQVIGRDEFELRHLLSALVRRISMLSYFHAEPHEPDFRELKAIIGQARLIDRDVVWWEQSRWSAAQREEIPTGGLVGTLLLDMAGIEPLYPYLCLGEWVHVGKGTVMGMGALRLFAVE